MPAAGVDMAALSLADPACLPNSRRRRCAAKVRCRPRGDFRRQDDSVADMSDKSFTAAFHAVAMLLAALVLATQLGMAMHSLHLDTAGSDSVCAFCTGGTQFASPPASGVPPLLHPELHEPPPAAPGPSRGNTPWASRRARAPPLHP